MGVFRGSKEKTMGGMTASSLTKNKTGKIVSKKKSALGKKNTWMIAVQKARKALKIKGFVAVKKGTALQEGKGVPVKMLVRASAQGVGMSTPFERYCPDG